MAEEKAREIVGGEEPARNRSAAEALSNREA